ncbi:MAG: hypothetical protein AAFP20_05250 [Cyanobacteria bacterium J06614_10]
MYIEQIPGNALDIDAGQDGSVWCIGTSRKVFRWNNTSRTWDPADNTPTNAATLAVDKQGNPWVTLTDNRILRFIAGRWRSLKGGAIDICSSDTQNGMACIGATSKQLFEWDEAKQDWTMKRKSDKPLKAVTALSESVYWTLAQDGSVQRLKGLWREFPGKALDIASVRPVNSSTTIACIGVSQRLFKWQGDNWEVWAELNRKARQLTLDIHGHAWILDENNQIYRLIDKSVQYDEFVPSQHGLRFANRFSVADIQRRLPIIGDWEPSGDGYGLCGGIGFTAMDHFLKKRAVPATTRVPNPSDRLWHYLLDRQIDSFNIFTPINDIASTVTWMALPDDALQVTTGGQLAPLIKQLNAGKLVPLYLIRVGLEKSPWDNHQVIAYKWRDRTRTDGQIDIWIYDPNHRHHESSLMAGRPHDDIRIIVSTRFDDISESVRDSLQQVPFFPNEIGDFLDEGIDLIFQKQDKIRYARCAQYKGRQKIAQDPIRGFFITQYSQQHPPKSWS